MDIIEERRTQDLEEILESVKNGYDAVNTLQRIYGERYMSRWEDGGELDINTTILLEKLDCLRIGLESELKAGYNDRYV